MTVKLDLVDKIPPRRIEADFLPQTGPRFGEYYLINLSDGAGATVYVGFLAEGGEGFYILRDATRHEYGLTDVIDSYRRAEEFRITNGVKLETAFVAKRFVSEMIPLSIFEREEE